MNEPAARAVNPFIAGLLGKCPRCGQGRLFAGYLRIAPTCSACGLDFAEADPGDGPAVFVIFIVGFIVVPVAIILQAAGVAMWANLLLTSLLTVGLCLGLLRPFKATLVALQYHHGAREARLDDE